MYFVLLFRPRFQKSLFRYISHLDRDLFGIDLTFYQTPFFLGVGGWNEFKPLEDLTLFQTSPGFLRVCSISLLKTLWEKEKLLVTSNFSFSHRVLYPFGELSFIFITFEIVVCNLFQFGRG